MSQLVQGNTKQLASKYLTSFVQAESGAYSTAACCVSAHLHISLSACGVYEQAISGQEARRIPTLFQFIYSLVSLGSTC